MHKMRNIIYMQCCLGTIALHIECHRLSLSQSIFASQAPLSATYFSSTLVPKQPSKVAKVMAWYVAMWMCCLMLRHMHMIEVCCGGKFASTAIWRAYMHFSCEGPRAQTTMGPQNAFATEFLQSSLSCFNVHDGAASLPPLAQLQDRCNKAPGILRRAYRTGTVAI